MDKGENNEVNALAKRCLVAMLTTDTCTENLGMKVTKIGVQQAWVEMPIRQDMLNGHRTCHGGILFCLCDSAFAFACNSENQVSVALDCVIDFIRPAYLGDTLIAKAQALSQGKVTGNYLVEVQNQTGQKVAIFRGKSYRLGQPVLKDKAL